MFKNVSELGDYWTSAVVWQIAYSVPQVYNSDDKKKLGATSRNGVEGLVI